MPFEASLSGPRGRHQFSTLRRRFVERGDINDTVEALSAMLDPVSFTLGSAEAPARAVLEGGNVLRAIGEAMTDEVLAEVSEALDSWNPMTFVERLWSSSLDDMIHRELMSAIIVCLLDYRLRSNHLSFVITRFGPVGMLGGMFQVGRDETHSVLHVDPIWSPAVMGAKLVKKLRKVGLNDWGHLMALCHMFGQYSEALLTQRRGDTRDRMVIALRFYDL